MSCKPNGICHRSYRKGGSNAVHCQLQTGGKWDFCKYQYLCRQSNRYELSREADTCSLREAVFKKTTADLEKNLAETENVIAEMMPPKIEVEKTSGTKAKRKKGE